MVLLFTAVLALCCFLQAQNPRQDSKNSAIKAAAPFHWGRVKFGTEEKVGDVWDAHPWADAHFLTALEKYTNINVDKLWREVPLEDLDEMVKFPFLFITGEGWFNLSPLQKKNIKEYLERGGFLFGDDCVIGNTGDHFYISFRKEIEQSFNTEMVKLPADHAIYHSLYDFNGLPYMQGQNHGGHALFIGKRMAIFLSPSDLHCGWGSQYLRTTKGNGWFTLEKEEAAVKMGINVIVYAMTN